MSVKNIKFCLQTGFVQGKRAKEIWFPGEPGIGCDVCNWRFDDHEMLDAHNVAVHGHRPKTRFAKDAVAEGRLVSNSIPPARSTMAYLREKCAEIDRDGDLLD